MAQSHTSSSTTTRPAGPAPIMIAVSSGKGGVGKSTVSTNLAVSLAKIGLKVGLLDTDIYGPNIPLMMGIEQPPMAQTDSQGKETLIPPEAYGVKVMSMGFLLRGDQPVVWRGPMLHSVIQQFLTQVDWTGTEVLVLDLPPGTGDVQLSLTQMVALTGAVVVTTPQEVALQDVRKAVLMFEKVGVPVLGVLENMSYFTAPDTGRRYDIFGSGGAQRLCEKFQLELLGQMPLIPQIREGGDQGRPYALGEGSDLWLPLAKRIYEKAQAQKARVEQVQNIKIGDF